MEKLVILGGGISGIGAAILGKSKGFDVFLSDFGKLKEEDRNILERNQISYEEEGHTKEIVLGAQLIVKSPGIPSHITIIQQIIQKEIPLMSEIEFASRYTTAVLIAVTGSNGKTTTTSLIYHILKNAGYHVGLAGNIGRSFSLQVLENNFDYYVLEVSSFQLDNIEFFKPHIALILNITPDHMDRYDNDFQQYIEAKLKIAKNQTKNDFLIYNQDDKELEKEIIKNYSTQVRLVPFSLNNLSDKNLELGAYSTEKEIIINKTFNMTIEELSLQGKHNVANSMAAGLAAKLVNIKDKYLKQSLSSFESVEHRLEKVLTINGISFINDSKATNVNSVYYALESVQTPIVWIVGGQDKGNDYEELLQFVKKKVRAIVCLGLDNKKIVNFFGHVVSNIAETDSMEEAVKTAYLFAEKGDTVLLSPACASFDLFKNYEERGNLFKIEVAKL